MTPSILVRRGRKGFTLVELLVVVLIIGILAAIATPQYFKIVEKGRTSEAMSCANALLGSQEQYFLKNLVYTSVISNLDTGCPPMRFFTVAINGTSTSWTGTFTRLAPTPPIYGAYTFAYSAGNGSQAGFSSGNAAVSSDLLP